ncbi:MAG: hypothetical protein ACYTXE_46555, partial [Nostoc sp.]
LVEANFLDVDDFALVRLGLVGCTLAGGSSRSLGKGIITAGVGTEWSGDCSSKVQGSEIFSNAIALGVGCDAVAETVGCSITG